MFWKPLLLLAMSVFGQTRQARLDEIVVCIGLSLLLWLLPYIMLRVPCGLAFLYPVTILAIESVAF
jgi:hypothetical protein